MININIFTDWIFSFKNYETINKKTFLKLFEQNFKEYKNNKYYFILKKMIEHNEKKKISPRLLHIEFLKIYTNSVNKYLINDLYGY